MTVANILNRHFNEVGNKYGHIPNTINEHLKFLDVKSNDTFRFSNITFHEVRKVLVSMNKNKSTNDEIPLRVFRLVPDDIIRELVAIYARIISAFSLAMFLISLNVRKLSLYISLVL